MMNAYEGLCCHKLDELSAFRDFDETELRIICDYVQCLEVVAGEGLWKERDECGYVAFIVSGKVKVTKETDLKGNAVVMGIYGRGSFVGVICVLDGSPRVATVEVIEDASLLIMTKEKFDRLLSEHPEVAAKLMRGMLISLSRRLKNSFNRLVSIF
jgi:CRP-like cAMP-binding protein